MIYGHQLSSKGVLLCAGRAPRAKATEDFVEHVYVLNAWMSG